MATTKTIQATVKNRTDTAANWTQKNPVLAEGEIIVVQTSAGETRLKIGDGVKTFTQLPYTDEQIYNSVVTSVNGQTGDITMNPVEYTPQTLTDAQKKQARENIGAVGTDFIINATPTLGGAKIDKTWAQISEAVSDGKTLFVLFHYGSADAIRLQLVEIYPNGTGMAFANMGGVSSGNIAAATVTIDSDGTAKYNIDFLLATDMDGALPQYPMASAPIEDMQIATKKYVDDKISDKELVLSSSTAGSTKKFKLTIDDTGTLTASEITA